MLGWVGLSLRKRDWRMDVRIRLFVKRMGMGAIS